MEDSDGKPARINLLHPILVSHLESSSHNSTVESENSGYDVKPDFPYLKIQQTSPQTYGGIPCPHLSVYLVRT